MMRIESTSSTEVRPSASSTVAGDVSPAPLSTGATSNNGQLKPCSVIKQPITPIGGKSNLLKLLNGSKSTVFKTIGDRIVVPMKVSTASKAANQGVSPKSAGTNTTFQMAIPAKTSNFKLNMKNDESVKVSPHIKTVSLNPSTSSSLVATKKVIIKKEISDSDFDVNPANNDLNKFMSSVTKKVFFPIKNEDQIVTSQSELEISPSVRFSSSNLQMLESFSNQEDDGDLTCLSWLSSNNKELLKTIRKCNPDDPGIGLSGDEIDVDDVGEQNKLIFTASSRVNPQNSSNNVSNDFMYNPLSKPPYSFSCLIFMAIEDSYLKRLPVKDIYSWVCKHFPYYRSAPPGWKNSIRHNLSLNRCFKKAEIRKDSAKGSLWCIDPAYRPNLVQALKRSPFYPYLHPTGVGQPLSLNNLANLLPGAYTGRIPSWAPALPPSTLWADPDMASAALNLMGLRKDEGTSNNTELISNTLEEIFRDADWLNDASRFRHRQDSTESVGTEPVVISGDLQDHTYTLGPQLSKKKLKRDDKRCKSPESDKSAPDAAYEFESAGFSDDENLLVVDNMSDELADDMVIEYAESDVEAEEGSLFDSGFGSMRSDPMKRGGKAITGRGKRARTEPRSPVRKSTRGAKRANVKATESSANARRNGKRKLSGLSVRLKETNSRRKTAPNKIGSDVDSGKDSPKIKRANRARRVRQRSYRRNNQSNYHTRSSRFKLLGQEKESPPKRSSRRKRKQSCRCNDDEEVKLAAGSLLRLAGLLKSPVHGKLDFN